MRFPFAWLVVLVGVSPLAAQPNEKRPPEALLPAGCLAYARYDGYEPHKKAYDRTALAKAMNDDLGDALEHIYELFDNWLAASSPEWSKGREAFKTGLAGLWKHGVAVGFEASDRDFTDWRVTIVLPQGINPPYRDVVRQVFKALGQNPEPDEDAPFEFKERKIRERVVHEAKKKDGGITIAWWYESPHAVVTIGTRPPDDLIAVADGKKPNLTSTRDYRRVVDFKGYETDMRGFVDLERIVNLYCTPAKSAEGWTWVSRALAARALHQRVGLTGLGTLTVHLGFDGKYQRSTVKVHVVEPSQRAGVLKIPGSGLAWSGKIDGLRMPPDAASIAVRHIDWERATGEMIGLMDLFELLQIASDIQDKGVRAFLLPGWSELAGLLPREAADPAPVPPVFRGVPGRSSAALPGALKLFAKEAAGALDTTYLSYDAPSEGLLSMGTVWAVKVKNVNKLERALEKLHASLEAIGGEFGLKATRVKYRGTDLVTLPIVGAPLAPTYAIHDGWWVVGLLPQPVKGFIWRSEPGRRTWIQPDYLGEVYAKSRANGPPTAKLGSITIDDPRPTITLGLSLLPLAAAIGGRGQLLPFDIGKLPHAQAVTEPLFPNVTMFFDDGDALRWESHFSIDVSWSYLAFYFWSSFF